MLLPYLPNIFLAGRQRTTEYDKVYHSLHRDTPYVVGITTEFDRRCLDAPCLITVPTEAP